MRAPQKMLASMWNCSKTSLDYSYYDLCKLTLELLGSLVRICKKELIFCHVRDISEHTKIHFITVIISCHVIFISIDKLRNLLYVTVDCVEPILVQCMHLITSKDQLQVSYFCIFVDFWSKIGKYWYFEQNSMSNHNISLKPNPKRILGLW